MNQHLLPYVVLFVLLLVVVVVVIVVFLKPQGEDKLPYIKKMYLMTMKERELFSILDQCVPTGYYIFPQVHIASILEVKKGEPKWQTYFNKIISKSVDFVIFDKVNISPVLAIELDDHSHTYEKRMIRDQFVNKAFLSLNLE